MPLAHPHRRSQLPHAFKRSADSPQSASSTPVASSYAQKTVDGTAPSVHVASIIAGVLSALVLIGGLLVWKFKVWNKRKLQRSLSLESKCSTEKNMYTYFGEGKMDSPVYVEKPKAAYGLEPSPVDSNVSWTPQVTSHRGVQMTPKQLQAIKSSKKKYAKWEKALQLTPERSPPPYSTKDPANIMLPPTPPEDVHCLPPPPTPPANYSKSKKARLMKVATSYMPKIDDEIAITTGETVRLVKEYEDGWCFIQRKNSKTGVVPRFCLVERNRA